jgi:hypothetical protein
VKSLIKQCMALVMSLALLLVVVPANAQAGTQSTLNTVTMSMNVAESITLSVTGGPVSFTYVPASNTATGNTISVTTTWTLNNALPSTILATDVWLSSPTAALTNGAGSNIASTKVMTSFNGGTAGGCNGNATAGLTFVSAEVAGAVCGSIFYYGGGSNIPSASGNRTDTVAFSMSSLQANLPAGTYTGTINIAAASNI